MPRIDLEFYGRHQELEYDLIVAPGGDPANIRLSFGGTEAATLDPSGDLIVKAGASDVAAAPSRGVPAAQRPSRAGRTRGTTLLADGSIGVELGTLVNRTRALVIDPVLEYSTLFGGSGRASSAMC